MNVDEVYVYLTRNLILLLVFLKEKTDNNISIQWNCCVLWEDYCTVKMSYLCSRTEDRARDFLCVSFSAPTWSLILCPHRGVCVGASLDGRLMSSFETLQAALQMKWHSSDCVWAHMPVKLESRERGKKWMRGMSLEVWRRWRRRREGNWWNWSYSSWATASDCSSW